MIMALHLVTGYKGTAHITSADQGAFNAALIGTEDYVCKTGRQFEALIMTNNSVRIYDGDLLMQGRHVNLKVGTYEDVTIENGAQGMKRNDLIVCRYAKDATSGQEAALFVVLKGTPTEGTASDPAVTSGDILGGAVLHEMPLYRVKIEGLSIVEIQKLYSVVSPVVDVVTDDDMKAYAVPITRKVNGKPLNGDVTLGASDVGARPNTWIPTASDVGAVSSVGNLTLTQVNNADCPTNYEGSIGIEVANSIGLGLHFYYIKFFAYTITSGYGTMLAIPLQEKGLTPKFRTSDGKNWSEWIDIPTSYSPLSHMRSSIDNRGKATQPNDYNDKFEVVGLKNESDLGLSYAGGFPLVGLIGFRPWSDSSGGHAYEFAFPANGGAIFFRDGSTTTWGEWNQFYGSHNITCGITEPTSLANGCIYEMYE